MKRYEATGIVYGYFWGGGEGSYKARDYKEDSRDELIKKIETDLKSGVLDSGMGYESLIGALMLIKEIETRTIEGKEFEHTEFYEKYFGDLDEKQRRFLKLGVSVY